MTEEASDPRILLDQDNGTHCKYPEELPYIEFELTQEEILLMSARCVTFFLCFVELISIVVFIAKGQRFKGWPLYLFVTVIVFLWIGMTLFQDYIDHFFVQEIARSRQAVYIYWCVRNVIHGLALYLILLVLAHMSEMHIRGHWAILVILTIFIPILYSSGVILTDIFLDPCKRNYWEVNLTIDSVNVFLYNVVTSITLFMMIKGYV